MESVGAWANDTLVPSLAIALEVTSAGQWAEGTLVLPLEIALEAEKWAEGTSAPVLEAALREEAAEGTRKKEVVLILGTVFPARKLELCTRDKDTLWASLEMVQDTSLRPLETVLVAYKAGTAECSTIDTLAPSLGNVSKE